MKNVLLLVVGLVGLIELLVPSWMVRLFTRVAYRDADDAEPREWFHVAARLEGAVLVTVALVGLFRSARGSGAHGDTSNESADEAS
ncbi:hypothetical protein [Halorubrum sp. DTA98]|uniref:hypothetical protein n=1 Tax=Halorubrum sp. DTA98 TaxID=3402163 RepID=UPI003AAF27F0